MKLIHKFKSPNFNERKSNKINLIIIHYTALKSISESIKFLCDKKNNVSSHYVISKSGNIYNLVSEKKRAWHAGQSNWKGKIDINSSSIGIELDYSANNINLKYPKRQIFSLIQLLKILIKKYNIDNKNILGHSDIAPYRKIDPGPKFPWNKLSDLNIPILPKKITKKELMIIESLLERRLLKTIAQKSLYMLSEIGFDISKAEKSNKNFILLIKAFQSHYRQSLVNGKIDKETYKILSFKFNESLTI